MSKAGHKSSKRGPDSCPLDLAKQKSLVLSAVSVKWLGTTACLELVEDTTWGEESERVRGKAGNSSEDCCYKGKKSGNSWLVEWLQEKVSFLEKEEWRNSSMFLCFQE